MLLYLKDSDCLKSDTLLVGSLPMRDEFFKFADFSGFDEFGELAIYF